MTRVLYLSFAILVALAGLAFHVRNDQVIALDFVVGTADLALSWVLVAALVTGALLGLAAMAARLLSARREIRRLRRRHERAEREVSNLRALTLKDDG